MGKSGGSAPDVVGAAKQEGIENRDTARDTNYANRPDQYNPFGSLTWGTYSDVDPASGEKVTRWRQEQGLSDPMEGLLTDQLSNAQKQSYLQSGAMNRAGESMKDGADFGQFGEGNNLEFDPTQLRQRAEDAAYGRETSRLDPQFSQRSNDMEVKLRNQGLRPGDEAYDRAAGNFDRSRNDAYEQARMGAVGTGRQESQQAYNQQMGSTEFSNALRDKNIQEYLAKRSFDLNEAKALNPTGNVKDLMSPFGGEA